MPAQKVAAAAATAFDVMAKRRARNPESIHFHYFIVVAHLATAAALCIPVSAFFRAFISPVYAIVNQFTRVVYVAIISFGINVLNETVRRPRRR